MTISFVRPNTSRGNYAPVLIPEMMPMMVWHQWETKNAGSSNGTMMLMPAMTAWLCNANLSNNASIGKDAVVLVLVMKLLSWHWCQQQCCEASTNTRSSMYTCFHLWPNHLSSHGPFWFIMMLISNTNYLNIYASISHQYNT